MVTAAEDFSSLARFRFFFAGKQFTSAWSDAFTLLRFQAQAAEDVHRIRRNYGDVPQDVPSWTKALDKFSAMSNSHTHCYELERFYADFLHHPVFRLFPRQKYMREQIHSYAISKLGLNSKLAMGTILAPVSPSRVPAYKFYGGKVPVIQSDEELADFLDVDTADLKNLNNFLKLPTIEKDFGAYDVDHLIEYKQELFESLISLKELEEFSGISTIDITELKAANIRVIRLSGKSSQVFVPAEEILQLHVNLAVRCKYAERIFDEPEGSNKHQTVKNLAQCVALARGDTLCKGWYSTYRWADIII